MAGSNAITENCFYCWIPILTPTMKPVGEVSTFKAVFADINRHQEVEVDVANDARTGFVKTMDIGIPEKCHCHVECRIESTGLVAFSFSTNPHITNDLANVHLAVNIFNTIRNIYHVHVHHDGNDDATLKPIRAENQVIAIEKILSQYTDKIVLYHGNIRLAKSGLNMVKKFYNMRNRLDLFDSALGEFIYAQAFIDLHAEKILNAESGKRSFQRSYDSIYILREKIAWTLMFGVSILVLFFTFFSAYSWLKDLLEWFSGL